MKSCETVKFPALLALLGVLMSGLAISAATPALAGKPAVRERNISLGISTDYSLTRKDESQGFVNPREKVQGLQGDVTVTLPVAHAFGASLSVAGGFTDTDFGPPVDGGEEDVFAGSIVDVFWRDPALGRFDVAYIYSWNDLDPAGQVNEHGAGASGTVYLPHLWLGEVDLGATFQYSRLRASGPGSSSSADAFGVDGGVRLYADARWALTLGANWQLTESEHNLIETEQTTGVARISWMTPRVLSGSLILDLTVEIGESETRFASPALDFSSRVHAFDIALSFNFPGARSLVELNRELF